MRQMMVNPLGVYDKPNEYGQYPAGALKRAYNMHMRKPGVLEPFNARATFRSNATGTYYARKMWSDDDAQKLLACSIKSDLTLADWRWIATGSSVQVSNGTFAASTSYFPQAMKQRDRWFVTRPDGVFVTQPSDSAAAMRRATIPAPQVVNVTATTATDAQAMPSKTAVNMCAVFVRTYSDGYELRSAPSWVLQYRNTTVQTIDMTVQVMWGAAWPVVAGDKVEFYKTATLDITGSESDAHDPGQTFYLANSVVLTNTDIANKYVQFADSCQDSALGQDLYTNGGQLDNGANLPPGICSDVTTFKGFGMYVEKSSPQFLQFRIPGAFGFLSSDAERTHGIGVRLVAAGTWTHGSAVIGGLTASEQKGMAVGQIFFAPGGGVAFTGGGNATITVLGGANITLDKTVSTAGAGVAAFWSEDVLAISGAGVSEVKFPMVNASSLAFYMQSIAALYPLLSIIVSDSSPQYASTAAGITSIGYEALIAQSYADGEAFAVRVTNGANYSPALPEISATAVSSSTISTNNIVKISKLGQPEHIDPESELTVGSGTIYRLWTTQDAVAAFCSDGLWRISGYGPGTWRADLVDPTLMLAGYDCVDSLFDMIYAYTNLGLAAIGSSMQAQDLTIKRLNTYANAFHGTRAADSSGVGGGEISVTCNPSTREVHVRGMGIATTFENYVYNETQDGFTTLNANISHSGSLAGANTVLCYEFAGWAGMQCMVVAIKNDGPGTDLDYYNPAATTAEAGQEFTFHPVMGADGDPVSLANWIDATAIFDGLDFPGPALSAKWNSYASSLSQTIAGGPYGDARATYPAPCDEVLQPTIAFGLLSTTNTKRYSFKGVSLRFVPAGEESTR